MYDKDSHQTTYEMLREIQKSNCKIVKGNPISIKSQPTSMTSITMETDEIKL